MKRSAAIAVAAGLVLAGTVAMATASANAATTGCRAEYSVASQWPGGFTGNIAVTNLGDPIAHWIVTFDFPGGQQLTSGWNATWTQSSAHVSAAEPSWGGPLPTGGTVNVGFNAAWSGANPAPTAIYLNGVLCTGTVSSPTGSPTGSPSGIPIGPGVKITSPIAGQIYGEPGTLQLAANASDPDGTITKVEFYTAGYSGSPSTLVATDTTAPYSYALTVTSPSVWYVTAIAYDNSGLTASDTVHIAVGVSDPAPPGAPTIARATQVTETTVDLSLSAARAGSNPIAAYDIYTSANGQAYQRAASTTQVNAFYTLTGLTPGTSYQIVARARDTMGISGPASAPVSVTTAAAGTTPGPPVAVAATSTTVTLTWRAPSVNADKVTGYQIIVPALTPTAPVRLLGQVSGQVTTLTITGLSPNTSYQAVVVALGVGTSSVRGTFSTTG